MNQWLYVAFAAGAAWGVLKLLRKDVTGVANKTREAERRRLQLVALEIELHAHDPVAVEKLAHYLRDTV